MTVLYEDNHIIIVNKAAGEIVQGDKTGDATLADAVKSYIKRKYNKPGDVFLGVVHRLDRPVSGVVVFARTSKALTRLCEMFRTGAVKKTYCAIVPGDAPALKEERDLGEFVRLEHYLTRNEKQNKAYASRSPKPGSKLAVLDFKPIARADRYAMIEVHLHTGRHHQIRCQLAACGMPIKGDLKYGAPRSNPDGSISLHSRRVSFIHPVSKQPIDISAPYPQDRLWDALSSAMQAD